MRSLLSKSLKWYIFILSLILGLACLNNLHLHGISWTAPALMSFGVMYLYTGVWKDLNSKTVICIFVMIGALALFGHFLVLIFYVLTGMDLGLGFFARWALLSFVIGVPAMMVIYDKYG